MSELVKIRWEYKKHCIVRSRAVVCQYDVSSSCVGVTVGAPCSTGRRAVPDLPGAMLYSVESTRITRVGCWVSVMKLMDTVCVVWAAYVTGVSRHYVCRDVGWNWVDYWRISTTFLAQTWYISHTVPALYLVRRVKQPQLLQEVLLLRWGYVSFIL